MCNRTETRANMIEIVIAIALSGVALALATWIVYRFHSLDRGMVIYHLDTDSARLASQFYFEKMTAIAQVTIAVLGAAWALLAVSDTKVRLIRWTAKLGFILANASLGVSLIIYSYSYDFIVARIFHHSAFDIDAPFVVFVQHAQQALLVAGLLDLVATIWLGSRSSA